MVVESFIPLIIGLGVKFFVGFLLGAFGEFFTTGSVYIGLGAGVAVGALFFLLLPF